MDRFRIVIRYNKEFMIKGCGGGQVVSALIFYSNQKESELAYFQKRIRPGLRPDLNQECSLKVQPCATLSKLMNCPDQEQLK